MGIVRKVNKDKSITYFIRYRAPPDGTKRKTYDKWEACGPSKREAEAVLAKRKTQIREGKYWDTSEGLRWTYNQLLDRYLDYGKVTKKPGTSKLDHGIAKQLRAAFGSLRLPTMTPMRVLGYIEGLLAAGKAPSTANSHLALLKHSFSMAVKWGLLKDQEHILRGVKLPVRIENERTRYLTPDEFTRLLDACSPLWRRLVLVAVHTGMRKGEILSLRWDHVNIDHRFIMLPVGTTKNRKSRPVELTVTVCDIFRAIQQEQAEHGLQTLYVFCNPKTLRHYRADFDTGWYTALKKTGLVDVRFHDLRRTTGSWLRLTGADLLTIKEVLGHEDLKSTMRYSHIAPLDRRKALDKIEAFGSSVV